MIAESSARESSERCSEREGGEGALCGRDDLDMERGQRLSRDVRGMRVLKSYRKRG
jgi:hypothetical protein